MPTRIPTTDVLLTLMGSPHRDDLTTTTLRLIQAMLSGGGRVQVWTCGYATLLTQRGLGEHKPRNLAAWSVQYPSTAALVVDMLSSFDGRLHWYACRFCSDDRGATDHLPVVVLRAPAQYAAHVAAAAKTVFVGVV